MNRSVSLNFACPHRVVVTITCGMSLLAGGADAIIIDLGAAESFAVLGASTVTNTGATVITGDLGVVPGTAITGFGPGIVTGGSIYSNDDVARQAHADATLAYNVLSELTFTTDLTGENLGDRTLAPGIYRFSSSAQLTGALTLDGRGQANPLFVFQIGSTLTTATLASMTFINGANACDTFFRVGSSATLGVGTQLGGTIIAMASQTLTTGTGVDGRIIALNGAVTLDTARVTMCEIPAPGMPAAAMLMLLGWSRRRRRGALTACPSKL